MKINCFVQRTIAWILWSMISAFGLFLFAWLLIAERDPFCLIALIFPTFASLLLALFLYEYPNVSLDGEGVHTKWWLRSKFYPWKDIRQVGISCFCPRGYYINRLVLVRADCSKRGYRDFVFHMRNFGKLIYISAKPDIVHYVRSCYGPLDFDLTDGGGEQSTVINK